MDEHAVLNAYAVEGVVRGEELYLPSDAMRRLVHTSDQNGLAVVGLDGFRIMENATVPLLDLVADFSNTPATSWHEFRQKVNRASQEFLRAHGSQPTIYFAVTMLSCAEWSQRSRA